MLLRVDRVLDRWWVPPVLSLVSVAVGWWLADRPFAIAVTVLACVVWAGTARLLWERWRFRQLQRRYAEAEDALVRTIMEEARRGAAE